MTRSILAPFYARAEREPDRLLYAFLDVDGRTSESFTYAQFLQRTTDIAAHIRRTCPLPPGERVLLAYPPGVEMICAFFACVRLGLLPVPVYPPAARGFQAALAKTDFIAQDCQAAAVLTDRAYYWWMKLNETRHNVATLSFKRSGVSRLRWIITTDADQGSRADLSDAHSDVLFLQYTSGSTREPRGVMVTHENVLANCDAVVDHQPIGVSWLPQYHDMGLLGYYIFFALKGGTTYGFSPVDFIRRPALWLETISKYRGTASSAPNFAYEYCLREDKVPDAALERLDLSSLRFLMTAAEPVRANVYRDFARRFARCGLDPHSFFSAYGLAEYTLAATNYGRTVTTFDRTALIRHVVQRPPPQPTTACTTLVSCGRTLGAAEIRIVDLTATPREARDGVVGEIWVRGPSKCAGYWQKPELTAATFDARLPGERDDAPGWLRTGDMGFTQQGELYICGRYKDMLIVRGQNHYPQDIEAIVEADGRIRKGCVAAFACERDGRETLVIVAELRDPRTVPDATELNQQLVTGLGVTAAAFVFIEARTIPKTSSGKIARHAVRERWLDGTLCVVAQVEAAAVAEEPGAAPRREWLQRFALTGFEARTLEVAGLDSIGLVELSLAIQKELEQYGSADLAKDVDVQVLQKIVICELFDLLDQVAAAAPRARLGLRRALAGLADEHRKVEAALMRRDARLRLDVTTLPNGAPAATGNGGILLTGGTGFFGPFLLASLLQQTTDDIHVLTRGNGNAMQRIGEGLMAVSADGTCPSNWERRVRPVRGDLSAPHLGLDAETWRALAEGVHTIYHSAALVNYLFNYQTMREANVGGTNEVVRLAMSHHPKVLNHISTTFVFGWSVKETLFETDTNGDMDRLDFGYSQSKWVAEQVVFDAMSRGLHARVFRPALLTPSVCGRGTNFDISIRLLAFMIRHGLSTTAGNQVSFCPADVAAANIVAIARAPDSLGATYHVTRDEYSSLAEITAIIGDLTGAAFEYRALRDFVPEIVERCRPGDILFPLREFIERSVDNISAMEFKRYDNSNYRRFRDASPHGRADPPLHDVVLGIVRFMRRHSLIPA